MRKKKRERRSKNSAVHIQLTDDYIRKMAGSLATNGRLLKALMREKSTERAS